MKIYKISLLCSIITFMVFVYIMPTEVSAQSNIISQTKTIYLNSEGSENKPIFNSQSPISPGDKIRQDFNIYNNNDFKCTLKYLVIDGEFFNQQSQVIDLNSIECVNLMNNSTITVYEGEKQLFKGNLSNFISIDFSDNNFIELDANSMKEFSIEYSLAEEADNSIMGLQYKFSIHTIVSSVDDSSIVNNINTGDKEKGITAGSLIQTGYLIDYSTLLVLGSFLWLIGTLTLIKSKVSQ